MTPMRRLLALSALLASSAAFAQAPAAVGAVGEVNGLVTMSVGSQVSTVAPGTPIFEGARFVSSSSATVQLNIGSACTISLQPNQSVVINPGATCQQHLAAVTSVSTNVAAGGFLGPHGVPLLGMAALAGVVKNVQERPVSLIPQ